MNFLRSRFKQAVDEFLTGGATDDGVVDEGDPLSFQSLRKRNQFQCYAVLAGFTIRLDKGAMHVAVFNQRHFYRNFRNLAVAQSYRKSGIGYGHYYVHIEPLLFGKSSAEIFSNFIHKLALKDTVRTGKIYKFKNRMPGRGRRELNRFKPFIIY